MPLDKVAIKRTKRGAKAVREDYVKRMKDNYLLILRTLLHDLIVSVDTDGNLVFVNDAAVEFWGMSSNKIIGTRLVDYMHPDDVEKAVTALQELVESKNQVKSFMIRTKSTMGIRNVAWNGVAIFDDEGNCVGTQATGKDLTDILHVEEELEQSKQQFESLFEVMVDPIVIVDMDGNILELSQSAEEILGITMDELVGEHFLKTSAVSVESKAIMAKNFEMMKKGIYIEPHPIEMTTKDGRTLLFELTATKIIYKGEPAILGIFHDFTGQKNAEERLRASEERFRILVENAPEAIYVNDLEGTFVDGNKQAEQLTGYKREELIGKNMLDVNLFPEKYLPHVIEGIEANKRGEKSGPEELEIIKKDGSIIFVENTSIPVEREGKIEVLSIARDITERKKFENALKESEERFRTIFEGATDGIGAVDPKTMKVVFANPKVSEIMGYPLDELRNTTFTDYVPKNELSLIIQQFQNHVGGKIDVTRYIPIVRKDKTIVYCDISSKFMNIGNQQYLIAFLRDVTEQKKAQDALRESEKSYNALINAMNDTVWVIDFDGRFVDVNDAAVNALGYSREELLTMGPRDIDSRLTEEDIKGLIKKLPGAGIQVFETGHFTKDGKEIPVEISSSLVTYKGKQAILSIARDITDRKKAETALKESEKRFRNTLDNMLEGCQIIDHNWRYLYINDTAVKHSRLARKGLLGKTMMDAYPGLEETHLFSVLSKCMKERVPAQLENEFVYSNGETSWFELSIEPVPEGIFILSIDISDRKEVENALRQQREMLETVTANVNAGLVVISKDYRILWANNVLKGYLGEIEGKPCHTVLSYRNSACPSCGVKEIFETGKNIVIHEQEVIGPLGKIWLEITATAIRDENGEIVAASEMSVDITERKKMENELKASLQRFKTIFDGATDGISANDPKTQKFVFANPRMCQITGYTLDELLNLTAFDLMPKKDLSFAKDRYQKQLEGKIGLTRNAPVLRKDGTIVYCDISSKLMEIGDDQYIVAFFRDTTELRKMERELRKSEERFRQVAENSEEWIWEVDADGLYTYSSPVVKNILGYSPEEIVGKKHFYDFFLPEEQEALKTATFQGFAEKIAFNDFLNRNVDKNGDIVWLSTSGVPVLDANGNLVGYRGSDSDITEKKRIEEQIKNLAKFTSENPNPVLRMTKDGSIIYVNKAAEAIIGDLKQKKAYLGSRVLRKSVLNSLKAGFTEKVEVEYAEKTFSFVVAPTPEEDYVNIYGRDITERKKMENELKESEEKFRTIFEGATEGILAADPTTQKFVFANPRMYEISGYSVEELPKLGIADLISKENLAFAMDQFQQQLDGKIPLTRNVPILRKDRTLVYCDISSKLMKIGNKQYLIGFFRDVTEWKKAEDKLLESEKRFKYFLYNAPEAIWIQDLDGAFIDGNKQAEQLTGYKREELIGKNILEVNLVSKKCVPRVIEAFETNRRRERSGPTDLELIRKDGSTVFIQASSIPVQWGKKIEVIGIARDVTVQKKAEEALRESEEKYREMLNGMNDSVWVIGFDGKFIDMNDAAVRILGYSREELLSMGPADIDSTLTAEAIKNLVNGMKANEVHVFETTHTTKGGKTFPVEISSSLVTYKGMQAILSIARDITERKKAQETIKQTNRQLKQSNNELESYTYVVSHDLKAPLRTIKSFGSFLLEDYKNKLDETGQDYLNRMVNASSRMDAMIEDLLILSRVGRKFTEFEKVDLNDILKEILVDLEATIKERNAKVVVDKLPTLYVHRVWKKQLFMNLITNGLKFNESKTPKIEVLYEERENDHLFKVQDNGIGIEEKYLERIFNLFERAPTEKKYEGTGAGLSICKKIVEQLGGKIWVESTHGKGSTFFFTLPKEIKQAEEK